MWNRYMGRNIMTGMPAVQNPLERDTLLLGRKGKVSRSTLLMQPQGPGTLHLHVPIASSLQKIEYWARLHQHPISRRESTLSVEVAGPDLSSFVLPLMEVLSAPEQAEVRAIFQPAGRELELCDYFQVDSLAAFVCKTLSGWLIDMMVRDRLTTVFQPIVRCCDDPEPEAIFGYECLLRSVVDGAIIYPNRMLDVARGAGLLFQLDLAARRSAIREAARHNIDHKIFINFSPTAIADPVYGLRSTVENVDKLGLKREQVVFEVIESEFIRDVGHLKQILDEYRNCGFGVALDDLGSGYSSLNLLGQLRPDYVKLDRELMRDVHCDPYKSLIAQKLLETAQALNISTIAEGVECEEQCQWLSERGADFAQGFHFARPASPPPLR
jgi:EAL domain-containing protein (putative c-di-GMP-specific phosphodiesterase class I)